HRHRLGGRLRARRGTRAPRSRGPRCRNDRASGAGDRRPDLRLHQRQDHPGKALPVTGNAFSPREIVSELDRYIVGQDDAKRAVAVALRNRWRRQQLPADLREEVLPAEDRVLDALVGNNASPDTRQKFRKMLREGALDEREIEIQVQESAAANLPTFEVPGMPGASMGMLNLGDIFGKAFGGRTKPKKLTVADSYRVLIAEESDKLLDQERVVREAIASVE